MNCDGWRYVLASVRGTAHHTAATPCQDFSSSRVLENPAGESILVAVVADGAGSALRALDGAKIACAVIDRQASAWIAASGDLKDLSSEVAQWVEQVGCAIAKQAERERLSPRDFATTLVAAVVGEHQAVCFQVGDGAIVVDDGDDYVPASWPAAGEYANTTYFVTDARVMEYLDIVHIVRPVNEIALFSDGLQRLALCFEQQTVHAPFFRPMFVHLRGEPPGLSAGLCQALAGFLDSTPINERTSDDKTLLLASRPARATTVIAIENER